jgi:prepilin-type N-terminal cleavage/methylation domain-containing protein
MAGLAQAEPAVPVFQPEEVTPMDQSEDREPLPGTDSGFGLIEIIVSMFLLALLAAAFLPVLMTALTTSVRNSTIATANQLVGQQLDELRLLASNCVDVSAFDDAVIASTTDERGTVYQPFREVAACPAVYPGTVEVRAWVTENGATDALTDATTLVYLESAAP